MIKPKFKIGDKVRVIDGRNNDPNYTCWCNEMTPTIGKIFKIVSVSSFASCVRYTINDRYKWLYDELWLQMPKKTLKELLELE